MLMLWFIGKCYEWKTLKRSPFSLDKFYERKSFGIEYRVQSHIENGRDRLIDEAFYCSFRLPSGNSLPDQVSGNASNSIECQMLCFSQELSL
jgi:hypothetical protein